MAMVSPSILSRRISPIWAATAAPCWMPAHRCFHYDVMDGHFVPNISFGVPVLKKPAQGSARCIL